MSGDAGNEYFADGLSEELLNLLAKIPELRVAARTSAFKFKGEKIDVQEVAQKLNVAHILEGSVRKSGKKVRITAQLIKAADGYHLWSETYDRTLDDIFVVQDDIAGEVVKALKLTLLGTALTTRSKPQDSEAYNLALQGRFFLERRGQKDLERAVDYFRRSRERDPELRPGLGGPVAGIRTAGRHRFRAGPRTVIGGRARPRRRRWRSIPSSLTRIWRWAGFSNTYDWDWEAADASFRRALDLEPGNAQALRFAGIQALTLGRWSEAIDLDEQGHRARSAASGFLQQPRPRVAGSQPRHGGRGRVSQGPRARSRRGPSASGARAGPAPAGQDRRRPAGDAAGNGGDLAALRIAARISRARPAQRVRRGAGGPEGASTPEKWPTRSPKCMPSAARPTWPSSGSSAPTTSATAASRTSRATG